MRRAAALIVGLAGLACGAGERDTVVERADSAGVAVVTNYGPDVALDPGFTPTLTLGGADEGPEAFFQVGRAGVAVDDEGNLYVLDRGNHRVVVFDSAGNILRTLGREGGGPGEFQLWPSVLALAPDGSINVYDIGKRGLVRFAADGGVLPTRRLEMAGAGGRFAFADAGLILETRERRGPDRIPHELLIAIGAEDDTTVLADMPRMDMKPVDLGCVRISGMALLFAPPLAWAARGPRVLFSVGADYRIDVYEGTRLAASIRRTVPPRETTAELAAQQVGDSMRVRFGGGGECAVPPARVVEERGYAAVLPAIEDIAVAPDGTIWVERFAVRGEDARVDLFASDGAYRGTLPPGAPFPAAFLPDGRLVAIERDELDVERLVAYRVEGGEPEVLGRRGAANE